MAERVEQQKYSRQLKLAELGGLAFSLSRNQRHTGIDSFLKRNPPTHIAKNTPNYQSACCMLLLLHLLGYSLGDVRYYLTKKELEGKEK